MPTQDNARSDRKGGYPSARDAVLPNRYVAEFSGDPGSWTIDVRAEVDSEGISHVHITVEERRPGWKRPRVITTDLSPANADDVGRALSLAADWCIGEGGSSL